MGLRTRMPPLSVRLAPSRFLDPVLLVVLLLGVALWLSSQGPQLFAVGPGARRARWGRVVAWAAWAGLWVLSMPFVASALTAWTEMRGPDLGAALAGTERARVAMVVPAGGLRTYDASSPPRERLDAGTTQRVLTAS